MSHSDSSTYQFCMENIQRCLATVDLVDIASKDGSCRKSVRALQKTIKYESPIHHLRRHIGCRNVITQCADKCLGESPEPAPPAVPPRSMNAMHPMEALGRRARLGYLESECESEPPYLPTMLTSTLNAYASQEADRDIHQQRIPHSSHDLIEHVPCAIVEAVAL
ncbi:teneurin-m [Caerostris extrusa]|uniref:Teneurin-m n=1 Tax=Caerostris extrusa TaxID=172846 RepID=A0AAV4RH05_CAEEX|nr:teneurin-m [Caerostris extrusa]